jgi:hypothetical protein
VIYDLLQLNNQYYELDGLVDATTLNNLVPTYINNGAGQIQVLDPNGNPVVLGPGGATTSLLIYVAGSNGVYRALISTNFGSFFNPPLGRGYTVVVDLTTPGGGVYHRELLAESIIARGN